MSKVFAVLILLFGLVLPSIGLGQAADENVFIQISSHTSQAVAVKRAKAQLAAFPDSAVYRTASGSNAVVIASIASARAASALSRLKANGLIPAEAFALPASAYRGRVWSNAGGKQIVTSATAEAIQTERRWSESVRRGVQNALIWSGDYVSRIDGDFGTATRRAIKSYQLSTGDAPTGFLTPAEIAALETLRKQRVEAIGFRVIDDTEAGLNIGIPTRMFPLSQAEIGESGYFKTFAPQPGETFGHLTLVSHGNPSSDLRPLFDIIRDFDWFPHDAYSAFRDDWFAISGGNGSVSGYAFVRQFGYETKGFILSWPKEEDWIYGPISIAMFDSMGNLPGLNLERFHSVALAPVPVPPAAIAPSAAPPPPNAPTEQEASGSAGTGFYVNSDGYLVTNQHVIGSCTRNLTAGGIRAIIVIEDKDRDLAVLKTAPEHVIGVARFAFRPIALNADVTAVGFPLPGILQGLNVTRGSVSGMFGIFGDNAGIQITAPVQPGNSGGPLIDENGSIVGVVQSKLDTLVVAKAIGDIPQNVNFAIRGETVQTFLSQNAIDFEIETDAAVLPPTELAAKARGFTVQIECD